MREIRVRPQVNSVLKRVILLVCVALLCSAGTWAYLLMVTAPEKNVFTFNDDIQAELKEPSYTATASKNLVPGIDVAKDPQISNPGTIDEYVAMRITLKDGKGNVLSTSDYSRLMSVLSFKSAGADGFNTTDWVLHSGSGMAQQIWYYDAKLSAGQTTTSLFDSVRISGAIPTSDITWIRDSLGGFEVVVEGSAVQESMFSAPSDAIDTLVGLFV